MSHLDRRAVQALPELDAVNSGFDERDPFVSAGRSRFFYASKRKGTWLDMYPTRLNLPTYR